MRRNPRLLFVLFAVVIFVGVVSVLRATLLSRSKASAPVQPDARILHDQREFNDAIEVTRMRQRALGDTQSQKKEKP